jgi:serine/threonine-protein kinase
MTAEHGRRGLLPGTEPAEAARGSDDRPALSGAPPTGSIIAGKYQIERVIGAGGMGVVVAALHLQLGTRVAIKFLLRSARENPDTVARFAREARAAASVANEHVARVLDVGALENGAPFIVMEFLEGVDLATRLRERGPMPVEEAVECVLQACEALSEVHAAGIVHRDLKPANLFWLRRPSGLPWIKVLDFGISKVLDADPSKLQAAITHSATVMGSPPYMSPEQLQSTRSVDARTDIWALGVILFELITGRSPFIAATFPEVYLNIAVRAPPSPREFNASCPVPLEAAILRCLSKRREDRFRDVAALARALLPFGSERARASVEHIARTAAGTSGSVDNSARQDRALEDPAPNIVNTVTALGTTTPLPTRRRRSAVVLGIAGGLGSLLAFAFLAFGGPNSWRPKSAAPTSSISSVSNGVPDAPTEPSVAPASQVPTPAIEAGASTAAASGRPSLDAPLPSNRSRGAPPRGEPPRSQRSPAPSATTTKPGERDLY